MSESSKDPIDKSADIKNAASLLLKGGSLISEPCSECGGIQVKFKEIISCVNCGNKKNVSKASGESLFDKPAISLLNLDPAEFIIREKILMLSREIKDENDIGIQKQKADLIDVYASILERIRVCS